LNTWVSFQSAEQPLRGQFSVSGNTQEFGENWASNYRPE
jgi:DNA helicase-2/ATP-dependent DNA helicase PcrA